MFVEDSSILFKPSRFSRFFTFDFYGPFVEPRPRTTETRRFRCQDDDTNVLLHDGNHLENET